jgi:hypothetical protein
MDAATDRLRQVDCVLAHCSKSDRIDLVFGMATVHLEPTEWADFLRQHRARIAKDESDGKTP